MERIELAFLRMMRRLEAERRRAGSAALRAQEEERARVARDLHDEVNQSLTGLLLRLEAAREAAPPELEAELAETKALANQAMRELLSLARQLRPTALDDLGLAAAIAGQVEQVCAPGGSPPSFEPRATSPTSTATCSSSSTGSPRRRSPTPRATRAPSGSRCALRRSGDGGVELDGRRRRARLRLRRVRAAASGSPGCASGRCWSAAELTIESRPRPGATDREAAD